MNFNYLKNLLENFINLNIHEYIPKFWNIDFFEINIDYIVSKFENAEIHLTFKYLKF
jgi:hypothetical protein